jgi:hypothetical protein
MLFPSATIGDLQFRLLLIRPLLGDGRAIEVQHRLDTIIGEGRTTIEERSAGRAALLLAQHCTLPLKGGARDDWQKGLAALGPRPVGMPLWIDALPVSRWAERIYDPLKAVNFDPASGAFAIYDGGSIPGSPPYPLLAPLVIGRWSDRPPAELKAQSYAEIDLTLQEASPWECRIGIHTQAGGWAALPDRSSAVRIASQYKLEQQHLGGAVREPMLDATNAAARWRQEGDFLFRSRTEIRQHLSHFVAQKGATLAWSPVPAWFQTGAPTTDTPDSYTARFDSDTLALSYTSGKTARASVAFLQEIDTGARSQAVASESYLYTLTYQHDPANPELYTNWDAPLAGAEGSFVPKQCAHKEIVLSLRPQDVKADLTLAHAPGSLMADWLVGRLFGRVAVKIEACDPTAVASSRREILSGLVKSVLPDGNELSVTVKLLGDMLDKRVPSDVFSARANCFVFDTRCGLNEADYRSAGTIAPADVSADGFTVVVHGASGWGDHGTGTYDDNWFGPNGIFRTGSGRSTQNTMILASTMADGDLVLTLNRPIFADMIAGGGQAVQLVPGCGGQYDTDCTTKFNNADNFRGFPFMPDYIEQTAPNASPKPKK